MLEIVFLLMLGLRDESYSAQVTRESLRKFYLSKASIGGEKVSVRTHTGRQI